MERFRFNTAVAALMEYLNYLVGVEDQPISGAVWRKGIETLTVLLAPVAPFITEEVWQTILGHQESVHRQTWPSYDEQTAADKLITVVVQVNGKLRDKLQIPAEIDEESLREAAINSPGVRRHTAGKTIIVPRKLVNIVV
jgi:leucyl-tRNA synthetase